MKKTALALIILLLVNLCFFACSAGGEIGFVFGTSYRLEISGLHSYKAKKQIINMLLEYESLLGTEIEGSDLYTVNESNADKAVNISTLTADIYNFSYKIYDETGGAFNPAIFPLVRLWGFSPDSVSEEKTPPETSAVNALLSYCSPDYFELDNNALTITKSDKRAELDFGAVAKGHAAQRAIEILKENGIKDAIINIGGTVAVMGDKKVGVTHPRKSSVIASFNIFDGETVATSGDYERYYIIGDKRYHHIIDPATGRPADNGIISVTIVSDDGALSDALSTAVFVMGAKDGLEYAVSKGAKCLIILEDKTYLVSQGFEVRILDDEYTAAK